MKPKAADDVAEQLTAARAELAATRAELAALTPLVKFALRALSDSPQYRFVWDAWTSDEQKIMVNVRARLEAALDALPDDPTDPGRTM